MLEAVFNNRVFARLQVGGRPETEQVLSICEYADPVPDDHDKSASSNRHRIPRSDRDWQNIFLDLFRSLAGDTFLFARRPFLDLLFANQHPM